MPNCQMIIFTDKGLCEEPNSLFGSENANRQRCYVRDVRTRNRPALNGWCIYTVHTTHMFSGELFLWAKFDTSCVQFPLGRRPWYYPKTASRGLVVVSIVCAIGYVLWYCSRYRIYFVVIFRYVACRRDQFRCHNSGHCVAAATVCDGNNNCGDWSDENCTGERYFCV